MEGGDEVLLCSSSCALTHTPRDAVATTSHYCTCGKSKYNHGNVRGSPCPGVAGSGASLPRRQPIGGVIDGGKQLQKMVYRLL